MPIIIVQSSDFQSFRNSSHKSHVLRLPPFISQPNPTAVGWYLRHTCAQHHKNHENHGKTLTTRQQTRWCRSHSPQRMYWRGGRKAASFKRRVGLHASMNLSSASPVYDTFRPCSCLSWILIARRATMAKLILNFPASRPVLPGFLDYYQILNIDGNVQNSVPPL